MLNSSTSSHILKLKIEKRKKKKEKTLPQIGVGKIVDIKFYGENSKIDYTTNVDLVTSKNVHF